MSKTSLALTLAAASAIVVSTVTQTRAASPNASSGESINHLGVAWNYSGWTFAGYFSDYKKLYKNAPEFEFTRMNAIIGYDVTRWLTIYGVAGTLEQKVKNMNSISDSAGIFGLGFWANLMEADQLSYFDGVDRYLLSLGLEGVFSDNDFGTYSTIDGHLFFEVQGDVKKRAFIFPRTIGIYIGPVFSVSVSSDYDSASGDAFGFGGGLNVKFTDNVSLKVGGDSYSNDTAFYAQFSINF